MNKQYLLAAVLVVVLLFLPLALPYVFQTGFWAESVFAWIVYFLVAGILAVYLFSRFLQAREPVMHVSEPDEEAIPRPDQGRARTTAIMIFGAMILIFIVLSGFSFLGGRERPDPQAFAFQGHDAVEGKRVFQAYNCMGCHTMLGNGAYFAPDLTKVYEDGGAAWPVAFLSSPGTWPTKELLDLRINQFIQSGDLKEVASPEEYYQKYPHVAEAVALFGGKRTVMPNLAFQANEISALVAFLNYASEINTAGWPPQRKADASFIEQFQSRFGVVLPPAEALPTAAAEPAGSPASPSGGPAPATVSPPPTADSASLAAQGEQLARKLSCTACHSTDGSKVVGPTWKGLYDSSVALEDGTRVTADETYLQESILDPGVKVVAGFPVGIMPAYTGQVTSDEIQALIAYIRELK